MTAPCSANPRLGDKAAASLRGRTPRSNLETTTDESASGFGSPCPEVVAPSRSTVDPVRLGRRHVSGTVTQHAVMAAKTPSHVRGQPPFTHQFRADGRGDGGTQQRTTGSDLPGVRPGSRTRPTASAALRPVNWHRHDCVVAGITAAGTIGPLSPTLYHRLFRFDGVGRASVAG